MKTRFILFYIILPIFITCKKDIVLNQVKNNDALIGYWINPDYQDTIVIYSRSLKLIDNDYGIVFLDSGKFVERKNSGWCGTPPVSLKNYDGSWNIKDSILNISVGYWGRIATYKWKLVSVTYSNLRIQILEVNYTTCRFMQN